MWEFEVLLSDQSREIIFGYNFQDACRRSKINPDEATVLIQEYID